MANFQVKNPEETEVLGEIELTDPGDVAAIVEKARAARKSWSSRPVAERAACLDAAADSLVPHKEELAKLLAAESGKPIS